jgi:hypothetical protein
VPSGCLRARTKIRPDASLSSPAAIQSRFQKAQPEAPEASAWEPFHTAWLPLTAVHPPAMRRPFARRR